MGREICVAVAMILVALAGCIGAGPTQSGGSLDETEGHGDHEHDHGYDDGQRDRRRISTDRIRPQPAGTAEEISLDFGPFVVGPGQDQNRVRVAVPADGGFVTQITVRMVDPATGRAPSHAAMHMHHGHWWGIQDDPSDLQGAYPLLEWRWGSGDERTRGNATAVADADADGPRYGVYLEGGEPQLVDFMLHNRLPQTQTLVVRLEIVFVHGSADQIAAASDCSGAPEDARCLAGETFHGLEARLWGGTFDVPRQADGDGTYVWPPDSKLGRRWHDTASGEVTGSPWNGTVVIGAGHLHQNGKQVVVANLGPPGSGCEEDVDGDGWPGVTIYRSRAEDMPEKAWPYSSEFQMTATQPGWRAPIHEGDRLTLFGTYANQDQAEEEAMAFAGVYVDPKGDPPKADHSDGCDVEALSPYLTGDHEPEPGYTIKTRDAHHGHATVCNREGLGANLTGEEPCNRPVEQIPDRVPTRTVHIEGFQYSPGGLDASWPADQVPVVAQGETLTWVNHDAKMGVRHTVTSCRWPCNGPMAFNYPQSSGTFDSGKLGNLDPASGGANGPEDLPAWQLDTSDLEPGLYAYYDRVHPWMRGWFEVVEGEALAG